MCTQLECEEEDGTTPVDTLLEQCIVAAWENGSMAFDEDFVAPKL